MIKFLLSSASFMGALAVILGAFGAHGLKSKISEPYLLDIFHKGVEYQFYHVAALLAAGLLAIKFPGNLLYYAGICFLLGILFFSGSLYLLATRFLLNIEHWTFLGPITPIGGTFFVIGWVLLFIHIVKNVQA